ncbi:polysaccharide lyase [Roseibium sp. MMSF_3412]|uniref:polysaccharide lyase n=1 Tax=Roseibium sp. MMSF_3412 TaxID=3046712 RepID=UPI00273F1395|nr:hypothetical protein [Roseibium sp. MMSF_3412]
MSRILLFAFLLIVSQSEHSLAGPFSCGGELLWSAPASNGSVASGWPLTPDDELLWGDENTQIVAAATPVLVTSFPAGSINPRNRVAPKGGVGFHARFAPAQEGCLSYDIRFEPGFEFNKGGKLPGLFGGKNFTGCTRDTGSGFSTRLMWGNNGTAFLYAYFADRTTKCGEVIGSGIVYFEPGRWHRVQQWVRLNDPGVANGSVSLKIDDTILLEASGRRLTSGASIEGVAFETFFGGSTAEWASPSKQVLEFRNFRFFSQIDRKK